MLFGDLPINLIQPNKINASINNKHDDGKNYFNDTDLEKLNFYLENLLLSNNASSRLSRNSNSDRKSTYSSASIDSKSSIHSQPWKPV